LTTLKIVGLATAGAGVAALVLGTVYAISARSTWNDAKDLGCDGDGVCTTQTGADLVDDAGSKATVATVAVSAGLVLAAGGVALWLFAPSGETRMSPAVSIVPGSVSLGVRGSF
jgi:hypothetical protein